MCIISKGSSAGRLFEKKLKSAEIEKPSAAAAISFHCKKAEGDPTTKQVSILLKVP
jgi:hypothetical protein